MEQAELDALFEFHRDLLRKCRKEAPFGIELSALATFLHSLYSGIENSFRRIAIELGEGVPSEGDWHRRLLEQMSQPADKRSQVISNELLQRLKEYLEFRHLFRNIYAFRLRWEKMERLVLGSEQLIKDYECEIKEFALRMEEALAKGRLAG